MAITPRHLFNKTMIVQYSTQTQDIYGTPDVSYTESDPINCRLSPLSTSEVNRYQKLNNEATFSIYCDPELAINPQDRVIIAGETYRILGTKVDSNGVLLRIDVAKTPYDQ